MALKTVSPRLTAPMGVLQAPPKIADAFYTSRAWRDLVEDIKRRRGKVCQNPQCRATGKRLIGDHIVELKDGGAPLDDANVQLLCISCHNTKTAERKAARIAGEPGSIGAKGGGG